MRSRITSVLLYAKSKKNTRFSPIPSYTFCIHITLSHGRSVCESYDDPSPNTTRTLYTRCTSPTDDSKTLRMAPPSSFPVLRSATVMISYRQYMHVLVYIYLYCTHDTLPDTIHTSPEVCARWRGVFTAGLTQIPTMLDVLVKQYISCTGGCLARRRKSGRRVRGRDESRPVRVKRLALHENAHPNRVLRRATVPVPFKSCVIISLFTCGCDENAKHVETS